MKFDAIESDYSLASFFNNYFKSLSDYGWSAVVLHSWQNLPDHIDSDIDYLVAGGDRRKFLRFVSDACDQAGWVLAQVMEHEMDSFYCVCFMTKPPWRALKLDVSWDYRRKGRLLLDGRMLLDGRRQPLGKSFHVPSAAAEFSYVLAKGLAKSKGGAPVIQRLEELWHEDPDGCANALRRYFRFVAAHLTESFPHEMLMEALEPGNPHFEAWRSRKWGISQLAWLFRRLRRPYGATFAINHNLVAADVAEILLPAFRSHQKIAENACFWQRRVYEYRSGIVVGSETLRRRSGVIDLTEATTTDACVSAALRHLHSRCLEKFKLKS